MKYVKFRLSGCDDDTYIAMDMDDSQLNFLETIQKLSILNSRYGCMPVIQIDEINGDKIPNKEKKDYV